MKHQRLTNWTPKRAHSFATRRLAKIAHLLEEIACCYGDVDQGVVYECDELLRSGFTYLQERLDGSLAEGRRL